jgi:hypothetical protein
LSQTKEFKYLGVFFDSGLPWSIQSTVRTKTMLAKFEFHGIDSWNQVGGTSEVYATVIQLIGGINSGLCVCMLLWDVRIVLGLSLMQSTPNKSLGVLSGVSPLAERCMYLNYKYLVTVFHKERLETLNKLNSERWPSSLSNPQELMHNMNDLAALFTVPDIYETMTDTIALVDNSMYPSVASKELTIITSDYATENMFYTDGSMIDDVAGYAVQNRNYEKGHQLSFRLKSLQLCIFKYDLVVDN